MCVHFRNVKVNAISLQVADQMAIAAGVRCDVDPLLANVMKTHCGKWEDGKGGRGGGRDA